ncbi:peptidase inhibitor family I36 protein [Myxococcus sp. K15C18031901]|uniref:peptidase inhibitor family I36 protein n=1 Tax=Myxococcus dinghuensis TaxID=2906761 RepID=UPI0020A7A47C|nr:peptidase inhibitor family I36 protein [Myxococcus dinghuensis]MCP3099023.1 peptidase inhibitor family I36 protein [Myxococcus dinghuensis]
MHWLAFGYRFTRSAVLGLSVVVCLGFAVALLLPAQAEAQEANPCPFTGVLCLFDGPDYTGAVWNVMAWPPGTSTCVGLPEHGWADRAVSAINRGAQVAALYPGDSCSGEPLLIGAGGSVSPLPFAPRSVYVY